MSRAFYEFLNKFYWVWFATWTFRQDKNPYIAKKLLIRFLKEINPNVTYFLALEWHKYRDSVHIHSLVGNVEGVNRLTIKDKWWAYQNGGIAYIYPYDKSRGAGYYLTKYIIKDLADWDIKADLQKKFQF